MKRWIIKLLGGVDKERFNNLEYRLHKLENELDSYSKSYANSWVSYKSSIDWEKCAKKFAKIVTTQKPEVKTYYGSTDECYFFYGKENYLLKSIGFGDEEFNYSGFLDGFGEIPSSFAKEMFILADKTNKFGALDD